MNFDIYILSDIIGMIGVMLVIFAFLLLQINKLTANCAKYLVLNILGSVLIIISILFHWNLSSFVIEILWLAISLIGLVRLILKVKVSKP